MKKIMRKVSLLSILLITIVAFTVTTTVFAALGSWTYHTYALNISGTSNAISGKMVTTPGRKLR